MHDRLWIYQIIHFLLVLLVLGFPAMALGFLERSSNTGHFNWGEGVMKLWLVVAPIPLVLSQMIFYCFVLRNKKPKFLWVLNMVAVGLLYLIAGNMLLTGLLLFFV